MRLIGTVDDRRLAQVFEQWLMAEGIECQVEEDGQIWVKEEDQVAAAVQHLQAFLSNPHQAQYQNAGARAAERERMRIEKQKAYQRNVVQSAKRPGTAGRTPLTTTLIVLCGIVALFTNFGNSRNNVWFRSLLFTEISVTELNKQGVTELNPASLAWKWSTIRAGELWRLVTPIFLHFGPAHIIFNLVFFWQLGRIVEIKYGTVFLGILVLLSAAISNGVQASVPIPWDGIPLARIGGSWTLPFAGMSGVCYALFGFVWLKGQYDPRFGVRLAPSTIMWMLGWMVFCMLPSSADLLGFRVANWAHGIGLVVGCLVAGLTLLTPAQPRSAPPRV